jgi:hypothetical protein
MHSVAPCPAGVAKNKGVHPKASRSKLKGDRPDRLNYFNYKNDSGKITSCCAVTGHKLLSSPGVADIYMFLMNTWNTLLESYQQRVYKNTLAIVKRRIQQAGNPIPAMVNSVEAANVDNAIHLDYLTSEVALEETEIGNTDPNVQIDNNCTDDELHFVMPGDSGDCEDEGDQSDDCNAIANASWPRWGATVLEMFDLGTRVVDLYDVEDGDNADEEEEAAQAHDGST